LDTFWTSLAGANRLGEGEQTVEGRHGPIISRVLIQSASAAYARRPELRPAGAGNQAAQRHRPSVLFEQSSTANHEELYLPAA